MKQKLLKWWKEHSLQVYETLFWLSVIMVVGSLLLFIVLVVALGSDQAGGNGSMGAFFEYLKNSWMDILVSILSGSVIGAISGALTAKSAVKKTMEKFAEKVEYELEKLYGHLENDHNTIVSALNPDNRILHEEHDKIQTQLQSGHDNVQSGINSLKERNQIADANFAALDKSTQNIMQSIEGFEQLVLKSARSDQKLRARIVRLEEQIDQLRQENEALKQGQSDRRNSQEHHQERDDDELEL